jgi:hypothetical protein
MRQVSDLVIDGKGEIRTEIGFWESDAKGQVESRAVTS